MSKQTGKPQIQPQQNALAQTQQALQPQPRAVAITETASAAMAAQAEALVKARMTIALARPRDVDNVRLLLLRECDRPGFADAAIYNKPIGKGIEGLSIRFAEAAIQLMGNLDVQCPVVYDDEEKRIVQVSVLDLETNSGYSSGVTVMKRVERKFLKKNQQPISTRVNSEGETVHLVVATDDEVLNVQNALISKTIRTHGLRLVPEWLKEECLRRCYKTIDDKTAEDPDAARRRLFDTYATIGILPDQVKAWLGKEVGQMTAAERRQLWGLYNAIRENEATWAQAMEERAVVLAEQKAKEKKPQAPTDEKKPAEAPRAPASAPAPVAPPKCDRRHDAPPCADPDCYLMTGDPEPKREG